ncbi:MAG: CoA-transferase subunit beta [Candidatus Kariarchaeaceae archaeon]|jgi:acyl CoA:acetate/3-ketoacid CoA transferase beta subunit
MSQVTEELHYTPTHLMAVAAARILQDNKAVFVGTGLPMIATMYAQRNHAPNLLILFEAGGIGPQMKVLPISVGDSRTFHRAIAASSMHDCMSLAQNGWIDYSFLGAAQIDKYGNLNTTYLGGTWDLPKVRLPGSGGANDLGSFCHNTIVLMRQDARRFVENVTFNTTPGYLTGYESRYEVGLPRNTGPLNVITQLGIYGFDKETKAMTLEKIHPGVTLEEIKQNSSFDIIIPEGDIPVTEPPTRKCVDLLRELDPTGMAIGK